MSFFNNLVEEIHILKKLQRSTILQKVELQAKHKREHDLGCLQPTLKKILKQEFVRDQDGKLMRVSRDGEVPSLVPVLVFSTGASLEEPTDLRGQRVCNGHVTLGQAWL